MTEKQKTKLQLEIKRAAKRFYNSLIQIQPPAPSFLRLMIFRMTRTSLKHLEKLDLRDYHYYKEKGWFESDYYYDTSLALLKKLAGKLFDLLGHEFAKNM